MQAPFSRLLFPLDSSAVVVCRNGVGPTFSS